jgi:hypothetical protein
MQGDRIEKACLKLVVVCLVISHPTVAMGQTNVLEQQKAISALRKAGGEVTKYVDESGITGLSVGFPRGNPLDIFPAVAPGSRSVNESIDYSSLRHLKSVPHLRRLEVDFLESEGSALRHIHDLKELRSLSINLYGLKAKSLSGLRDLPQLREFELEGTEITDFDIKPLASLTSLRELRLDCQKVTDDGIKKLQDALPRCKIHKRR